MLELHRVSRTTLRGRAQRSRVAEHFRQRNFSADGLAATNDVVHTLHHAAAAGQIAHHVASIVFRRFHFHRHHGFQDDWTGLLAAFLEAEDSGHLERQFVRVHIGTNRSAA